MYCSSCGIEIPDTSRYCQQCGVATGNYTSRSATPSAGRVFSRPRTDKKIAGVCAGIARYMSIDVTLVRVVMLVLAVCPPPVGLIAYLVCWIVMPQDPLFLPPPQQTTAASAPVGS